MPGHEGDLVPQPLPLTDYEARVFGSLSFGAQCDYDHECQNAAVWSGTSACCKSVYLLCEPHLKLVARKAMSGVTCRRCRFWAESLTGLWELDRIDR